VRPLVRRCRPPERAREPFTWKYDILNAVLLGISSHSSATESSQSPSATCSEAPLSRGLTCHCM